MSQSSISRRESLKQCAVAGMAFSLLPSGLRAENAPSKRVNLAMIGTGRQGVHANMRTFLGMPDVRVVAVCDVDRKRMDRAKTIVDQAYGNKDCKTFGDFREAMDLADLDAVMISTTDHWHGIMALHAMKKGLHVSCEKALTRYFDESRAVADAARKTGVVFRTDTECRSNAYMVKVANLVRNGYIGQLRKMEVGVPREGVGVGNPGPQRVPDYLDYKMWLGPAPDRPYSEDRVHRTNPQTGADLGRPGWMRISDYTAGMICNWGAHLIDVANLVNDSSHTGPISCEGTGSFPDNPNSIWDTIIDMDMQYEYANGVSLHYKIDVPYIRVEGEDGWIQAHWTSKGGLTAHDKRIFRTKFKDSDQLVPTRSDKRDFISAITKGTPVMIGAEVGHRVHSQCLLGLAAVRAGKKLEWDPEREIITNNAEAEADMKYSRYRPEWDLKDFVV